MAIRIPKQVDAVTFLFALITITSAILALVILTVFFTEPDHNIDPFKLLVFPTLAISHGIVTFFSYKHFQKNTSKQ